MIATTSDESGGSATLNLYAMFPPGVINQIICGTVYLLLVIVRDRDGKCNSFCCFLRIVKVDDTSLRLLHVVIDWTDEDVADAHVAVKYPVEPEIAVPYTDVALVM